MRFYNLIQINPDNVWIRKITDIFIILLHLSNGGKDEKYFKTIHNNFSFSHLFFT